MTTYTETQTVTHSLKRAGLLGDDETPSSDQLELARKIYRSRLASLQVRGVKLWNWRPDAVPEELHDPLADYVALFLIATAGGPRLQDAVITQAEGTLRALGATEPSGDILEAENNYF